MVFKDSKGNFNSVKLKIRKCIIRTFQIIWKCNVFTLAYVQKRSHVFSGHNGNDCSPPRLTVFWLQCDTQLRSQNIVICSISTAGDTGKAEGTSKAEFYTMVMMPAHILPCFLWILKQPMCHPFLLDRVCLYYLVKNTTDQTILTSSSSSLFSSMSSWIFSRYLQGLANFLPSCTRIWDLHGRRPFSLNY